jgi:streptomycin 3"-adenylyltransferase
MRGLITSKLEGGLWGLENLPRTFEPVIQAALDEYTEGEGDAVNCSLLKRFADYAMSHINDANQ